MKYSDEPIKKGVERKDKLFIIHSAGSVNLYNNSAAEKEVHDNNWRGTRNLLISSEAFDSKFNFISTAFSCGIVEGVVGNDFTIYEQPHFRNPYESCKNQTEKFIEHYCLSRKKEYQILRPSVVCGRLIDSPLYYISKFDVFYGWTKFFWNLKKQGIAESVRVRISADSKINVVPVDFVAKTVMNVFQQDLKYDGDDRTDLCLPVYEDGTLTYFWYKRSENRERGTTRQSSRKWDEGTMFFVSGGDLLPLGQLDQHQESSTSLGE
ncbi:Male sterility protein [Paenibacillus sophorae]|uniref:Male sterility protein n=1 Tax=Paenibacillus sophorae TaxID=1333845 RepID=A0A1H8KIA6_9BACL|nr:SDR family oxidoreductase [Paenibacillus sophorae]QWU13741.1 SDR family oxidoreductase [Paenibacillus sophorae]SEN92148.1 Male sterility protein [Paenibacillus sophorae]